MKNNPDFDKLIHPYKGMINNLIKKYQLLDYYDDSLNVAALAVHNSKLKYDRSKGASLSTFIYMNVAERLMNYKKALARQEQKIDIIKHINHNKYYVDNNFCSSDDNMLFSLFLERFMKELPDMEKDVFYSCFINGESVKDVSDRYEGQIVGIQAYAKINKIKKKVKNRFIRRYKEYKGVNNENFSN